MKAGIDRRERESEVVDPGRVAETKVKVGIDRRERSSIQEVSQKLIVDG